MYFTPMTSRPDYRGIAMQCMKRPENMKCVDCGAPQPTWSSCRLGTFICLNCAGRHRSYGVAISFVRAADMDRWTEEQAGCVLAGGNERFLRFMRDRGVAPPISYAAPDVQPLLEEYRELLRRDAQGEAVQRELDAFRRANGIAAAGEGEDARPAADAEPEASAEKSRSRRRAQQRPPEDANLRQLYGPAGVELAPSPQEGAAEPERGAAQPDWQQQ